MFTHDLPERKAQAWLRRARRLRESSRLEFDPAERQTLRALAEDCEAIAHRIISRWAATTANDDTHMPLTSPAFPPRPYRFVHSEFLIIVDKDSVDALLRRVAARLANRTVSDARGRKW